MAPSRTKQSRKARRVRRHYITLALTAGDYAKGSPEEVKFQEKLAKAQAAVEALELIGWETRAEGFTGADDEDAEEGEGEDEEAPAPRKVKKAKKGKAHKKMLKAGAVVKAKKAHADIPVTMATAGA